MSLNANCRTLLVLVAVMLAEYWVYAKADESTSEITLAPAKVAEKSFGVPVSSASHKETL